MPFELRSSFKPAGDQPEAIARLRAGLEAGLAHQTLLGVTGSGKTYTIAGIIQNSQRPTLVVSHNKTLAAQLYQEFRDFFPTNAVHYFVSYYDYYQPEAYIPQTDTYIDKDVKINEELDRLRHAATQALVTRKDVIVVASVSCIYNIGSPEEYEELALHVTKGQRLNERELFTQLIELQYARNDVDLIPGTFRRRNGRVEIVPPSGNEVVCVEIMRSASRGEFSVMALARKRGLKIGDPEEVIERAVIFPAKFWVIPQRKLELALTNIETELVERLAEFKRAGRLLEAQRLEQRTRYDLSMIRETGYCHGIENYSRHLEFRKPGDPPFTLLDYFEAAHGGKRAGWLTIIDESHMTIPQLRGMYFGDKARKETLIGYGFRLPSALDNRPLKFGEFTKKVGQVIYVSATPGTYEAGVSRMMGGIRGMGGKKEAPQSPITPKPLITPQSHITPGFVEQLVRPTGLLDPAVEIRKTKGQLPFLIAAIRKRIEKKQRALVLTLTKRLAEDLTEYLKEQGLKVEYLHAEVKTLERPERLHALRAGDVDVLVGINLLREGIDLPEVSLVAILDADKEGFLRNTTTLIQMMGRAARHQEGRIILFADTMTGSIRAAIAETNRRRKIQEVFNRRHKIVPRSIEKPLKKPELVADKARDDASLSPTAASPKLIVSLKKEMAEYVKGLEFEKAARVRDLLKRLMRG